MSRSHCTLHFLPLRKSHNTWEMSSGLRISIFWAERVTQVVEPLERPWVQTTKKRKEKKTNQRISVFPAWPYYSYSFSSWCGERLLMSQAQNKKGPSSTTWPWYTALRLWPHHLAHLTILVVSVVEERLGGASGKSPKKSRYYTIGFLQCGCANS
jgi:hypothetical protein